MARGHSFIFTQGGGFMVMTKDDCLGYVWDESIHGVCVCLVQLKILITLVVSISQSLALLLLYRMHHTCEWFLPMTSLYQLILFLIFTMELTILWEWWQRHLCCLNLRCTFIIVLSLFFFYYYCWLFYIFDCLFYLKHLFKYVIL
jgi:hypothetical protein